MTERPKLLMLVGPPCSGKSTWVDNNFPTTPILSTDRYIEQYANLAQKTYSEVFSEAFTLANQKMYSDLQIYTEADMDIIWDQTNLTLKSRKGKLNKIPNHYLKYAICFTISENEFIARNDYRAQNGKNIGLNLFRDMQASYIMPTSAEGFDTIIQVN